MTRGGDEQDLEHPVVLPLVELAVLQGRVGVAEPVGRAPHLPEDPRLVPVDDLGADDAHALDALDALGGLDEPCDGIGRERGVVVHQQEVVGGLGGRELGRGGQAPAMPRFSRSGHHPLPRPSACRRSSQRPVGGAVVDRDDAQAGVGLRGERLRGTPRSQPAASRVTSTTSTLGERTASAKQGNDRRLSWPWSAPGGGGAA